MKIFRKPKDLSSYEIVVGIIYFGLLLTLIIFQINQRQSIQQQVQDRSNSSITLVFQFDREVLRLHQAIELALASRQPIDREGILFRLEIAHSRLELLNNSRSGEEVISPPDVQKLLSRFSTIERKIENIVGAAEVDIAALKAAFHELVEIQPSIHSLSFETNTRILNKVERQYQDAIEQISWVIALLILQVLVVLISFMMLKKGQRQLRDLKKTLESRVWDRTAAQAEAESANRAKSNFIATASHDLRQPMGALALYTSMLGPVVKTGNGYLVSNIQTCVNSLSALLNDLMDIGKLDSGAVVTKPTSFSIEDLCTSMQASYGASAKNKGLFLRCRHAPNIVLLTDQQLLKRALGNLIDNAIKYTKHGGVLVATRQRYGRMWVEIWDTGIGIPENEVLHIFDEFKQLRISTCNHSSGLGLTITAKISTVLNLEIRVQSRYGHGSMFALELPTSKGMLPVSHPILPGHSIYTIGLVESNTQILTALVAALQSVGHTVFGATTVSALIGSLYQIAPDIVISDYQLESEQNGLQAIETLRAHYGQEMAAIVLTGDTNPALALDLESYRISLCTKPITLGDLQRKIEMECQGKSQPDRVTVTEPTE